MRRVERGGDSKFELLCFQVISDYPERIINMYNYNKVVDFISISFHCVFISNLLLTLNEVITVE